MKDNAGVEKNILDLSLVLGGHNLEWHLRSITEERFRKIVLWHLILFKPISRLGGHIIGEKIIAARYKHRGASSRGLPCRGDSAFVAANDDNIDFRTNRDVTGRRANEALRCSNRRASTVDDKCHGETQEKYGGTGFKGMGHCTYINVSEIPFVFAPTRLPSENVSLGNSFTWGTPLAEGAVPLTSRLSRGIFRV